ncbi:hypothetical protein Riv7116_1345 [Rivularia sp. PCC 7116]|uniref:hypothetical protein n=1 Tax=Rivularia sp. PCC 7116 TaxID=373994 RepID=UPI00029ECBD9|nr:hypothetical protein [Rivularia sp. PCC 7116]AFY53910.1 hypothetical protein Riv7116_1345 [Rivularia sp. PCC 7116]
MNLAIVEEWVYKKPDFAAQLNPIPQPKHGVRSFLVQGIKLDFMYKEDENRAWMIYYALLNSEGNLLSYRSVCEQQVKAYFRVLNPQLRSIHKQRIKPGIRFYVVVGSHKVAECVVTEVLHLVDEN